MKIVYLLPQSGFITELRSDTLWGLLCTGIRNVYGKGALEEIIETFNTHKPAFLISSAFPFSQSEKKKTLLFPKPFLPMEAYQPLSLNHDFSSVLEKNELRKKNAGKEFVSFEVFEHLINSNISLEEALSKTEIFKPVSISTIHHSFNRRNSEALIGETAEQYFHKDEYFFQQDIENDKTENGLFFLIKGDSEKVEGALRWLSHSGFGGDRSTGKGCFNVKIESFSISEPTDFNAVTNLSLYFPSETEAELSSYKFHPFFNYQVESRKGFTTSPYGKNCETKQTMMFKEGSVFPSIPGKEFYGGNIIVKNREIEAGLDHHIYRYGFGLMIKMKICQ